MRGLFVLITSLALSHVTYAQKPIIDSSVSLGFGRWPCVAFPGISNDGNYAFYTKTNVPVGKSTFVIKLVNGNWEREFCNVEGGTITNDSKWAVFKNSGDSLFLFSFEKDQKIFINKIKSYLVSNFGGDQWLAYLLDTPVNNLVIRSIKTGAEQSVEGVADYLFNDQGSSLLLRFDGKLNKSPSCTLKLLTIANDKIVSIWHGEDAYNYAFDRDGQQLAFIATAKTKMGQERSLWIYHSGMDSARMEVNDNTYGIDSGLIVNGTSPVFSPDGKRLFFQLIENLVPHTKSDIANVDVWCYRDSELQSSQIQKASRPKTFAAVIVLGSEHVIRLQQNQEEIVHGFTGKIPYAVTFTAKPIESWWDRSLYSTIYLTSTSDGRKKIVKDHLSYMPSSEELNVSPNGKWILFFDRLKMAWFSYNCKDDRVRNITLQIPHPMYNENCHEYAKLYPYLMVAPVGIAGWLDQDKAVFIYDDYDIWQVDPEGSQGPINITNGYGRLHNIKFRIAWQENNSEHVLSRKGTLLLSAFNERTKYNGFYQKELTAPDSPKLLGMGPFILFAQSSQLAKYSNATSTLLLKARDAHVWVLSRRSPTEAPNFFATQDFKKYVPISNIQPQKEYNWLTSELIQWKTINGTFSSGILYKPENFDPQKKYPIIFNYYEQRSDNLYDYPTPSLSYAEINIPYFVSRGYVVFVPDIFYRIGETGKSVVNSVVSAAKHLTKLPYIDSQHMGIQGHSFGGFETNYLITHTHLFAAAAEAAGQVDYISDYGSLTFGYGGLGVSKQYYTEISQGRIGATLWNQPKLFINNSPIFKADKVNTPLLIMHNKRDGSVPFFQGVEFFTALRRLHKRVWLLQYDEGSHVIVDYKDAQDYTIRLTQFFDYYLKGALPPLWMTEGVKARLKGIKTGYGLDNSGRKP